MWTVGDLSGALMIFCQPSITVLMNLGFMNKVLTTDMQQLQQTMPLLILSACALLLPPVL